MSLFHTSFVKGIWLIEESKYLGGQLLNFSKRVYVIRHDYKTSYLKSCAFFGQQNFSAWRFPQPETSWSQEDSCPCTVPDLSHFLCSCLYLATPVKVSSISSLALLSCTVSCLMQLNGIGWFHEAETWWFLEKP